MTTQETHVSAQMVEAAARAMYGKNWHEWNDQRVPLNRCRATIHAALTAALAVSGEREALTEENRTLRKEVWLRHGCTGAALYGDDGEMQCKVCMIDFRRASVDRIVERLTGIAYQRAAIRASTGAT